MPASDAVRLVEMYDRRDMIPTDNAMGRGNERFAPAYLHPPAIGHDNASINPATNYAAFRASRAFLVKARLAGNGRPLARQLPPIPGLCCIRTSCTSVATLDRDALEAPNRSNQMTGRHEPSDRLRWKDLL